MSIQPEIEDLGRWSAAKQRLYQLRTWFRTYLNLDVVYARQVTTMRRVTILEKQVQELQEACGEDKNDYRA